MIKKKCIIQVGKIKQVFSNDSKFPSQLIQSVCKTTYSKGGVNHIWIHDWC